MLTASLNAAAATDGIVDPLLGRQVVAAGYDAWAGQQSGIGSQTSDARWQSIEIRPGRLRPSAHPRTKRSGPSARWPGMARRQTPATIAHRSTGLLTIANMGGDLRVVSPEPPWVVAPTPMCRGAGHPMEMGSCRSGGTSGLGHRSGRPGTTSSTRGPRSRPAHHGRSVSVLAAEAAGANAAATAGWIRRAWAGLACGPWGLDGWFRRTRSEQAVGAWPRRCQSA